ncbi:MAG: MSMEG_0570 family nitrogen starvation response protein [Xanthobacteraceae bacterium]|jgi:uncharacterized repeat protein (TIGR04042 family)
MPEMRFCIRWPDGTAESCYSPSLIVKDYLVPGESYPLADFVERSRTALNIASERVEAKYGWRCSRAAAQLARIETAAQAFSSLPEPLVTVETFDE